MTNKLLSLLPGKDAINKNTQSFWAYSLKLSSQVISIIIQVIKVQDFWKLLQH